MDEMTKMIFKHHFVHERRCWWCKWRQSKQSAKIPPLVRARHAGKRQQRRWNPAAAKPFQLSWPVVGVEEAEIKASALISALMLLQMERCSTHLQQPGKALGASAPPTAAPRPQRQIQKTKFSVSKPCEGMLPNFQGLPVRTHIFLASDLSSKKKKKKRVHAFGSYQVKSQTVPTAPNQTKALRF